MKRWICMLLVMGLIVACALPVCAAVTFSDQPSIRNAEAVTMLVDLGLIGGYGDGTFRPGDAISRAETAKLIALLCTAEPQPEAVVFSDIQGSWARDYISYCAAQGVVGGSGGLFRPQDDVTAQELAKMLLVVLGYPSERYVGGSWAEAVNQDAQTVGIYIGYEGQYTQAVDRDDACLLIYNALRCYAVDAVSADGTAAYAVDGLMNPITYLEKRYEAVRYSAVLVANEHADLTKAGGKLPAGVTKLAGHREFQLSTGPELLGRQVDLFVHDGVVLGGACLSDQEIYETFDSAEEFRTLCQAAGYQMDASTQYYLNWTPATALALDRVPEGAKITVVDHTSDQVFDYIFIET